jgi:rhamnosyltransferase
MISICIPTKDAGPEFGNHLDAWLGQRVEEPFELLVIDSGSRDVTVEVAQAAGARLLTIPPAEFNHGETRNLLARNARGDILVFTVQDARPPSDQLLTQLTRPLREDDSLSGVAGKEVPRPDADLMARWEVCDLNHLTDKGRRVKRIRSLSEFLTWGFKRRFECVTFHNVCSAIRRSAWGRFPFSRIEFGEDLDWSFRVLKNGGSILHNPDAQILHSHTRPAQERLRRYFVSTRSARHILQVPPEHSGLTDSTVACGLDEFSAWVEAFSQLGAPRRSQPLLSTLILTPFPKACRKIFHAVALNPSWWILRRRVAFQLRLRFARLWPQVTGLDGKLSGPAAAETARQIKAALVGEFLGSYYHTYQVENRVTPSLREIVQRFKTEG